MWICLGKLLSCLCWQGSWKCYEKVSWYIVQYIGTHIVLLSEASICWFLVSHQVLPLCASPVCNPCMQCGRMGIMRLSMVCPTWHTWGRCWRKKENLALESSPRGYLVGIVKTSRKIHKQLRLDDHCHKWFIYELHSNCIYIMLKCLWKIR